MAALKLDLTIPLDDAGYVHLAIDITDLDALTPTQRRVLADTGHEFYAFAAATIAPPDITEPQATEPHIDELRDELAATFTETAVPAPTVYNTDGDVLRGVTGSRHRDKL